MKNSVKNYAVILVMLFLVGCSKDDTPAFALNQTEVRLNYDDEYSFVVSNTSIVTWQSSDEFVGTIDENGFFTAHHIGETTITATLANNATLSALVIVEPYISNILEPVTPFGASIAQVKALETRVLANESDVELLYAGRDQREVLVSYAFPASTLNSSTIKFNGLEENVAENVNTFYRERYEVIDTQGNNISFLTNNRDISISLERLLDGNIDVIYSRNDEVVITPR